MMKNDNFYWEKWLGPHQAMHSGSHKLLIRSVNKSFMFLFFNEFALQVILFYHQGHKRISILSFVLHFDTVTDITL